MERVKYNQNEYNKNFMDKVKNKKYKCDICDKEYSYYAKSAHLKSKFHKKVEELQRQKNIQSASNTSPESEAEDNNKTIKKLVDERNIILEECINNTIKKYMSIQSASNTSPESEAEPELLSVSSVSLLLG